MSSYRSRREVYVTPTLISTKIVSAGPAMMCEISQKPNITKMMRNGYNRLNEKRREK